MFSSIEQSLADLLRAEWHQMCFSTLEHFLGNLEIVISVVIQINWRLNICIGNMNSWLYFITALNIFINSSCAENAGKNKFLLQNLLKSCKQHLINSKVLFPGHLLIPDLLSCVDDFTQQDAKYEREPAQVSMIYWLTLIFEWCICLFLYFYSKSSEIQQNREVQY